MALADDAYDAAVVGAGPAGSATATWLARAGYRVVLLDKAAFPRDKPCAECISVAAGPMLKELGVLDELETVRPGRRRGFRIYAPNGTGFQGDFATIRQFGSASRIETGITVPRRVLDMALVRAAARAGAELRERWRLAQLARDDDLWRLTSVTGGAVCARLLIAADGVHSTVAHRLGLHVPGRKRKIGLVAHMRGIASLEDYVEMHLANRRYVGLAPLEQDGDLCNVALVVDEVRDGRNIVGRPQEFLLQTLATFPRLGGRLDGSVIVRQTLTISRLCRRARRLSADGLLLVGDAAGYYDPFTGEGIYRGLRMAQLASCVALPALARGDLSAATLARYDRLNRRAFRGKRLIEQIIQASVECPPLMNRVAAAMARHKDLADTIVGVTGDLLPPRAVLNPGYLLRLVI